MIHFKKEAEMLVPVKKFIEKDGFFEQFRELQFYDYSIDLYAYSKNSKNTIAIELKLFKWKRAIEQALVYQLCADLVYIALPEAMINKVNTDILMREGIGLIAVYPCGTCKKIINSLHSKVVKKTYKEINLKKLRVLAHV